MNLHGTRWGDQLRDGLRRDERSVQWRQMLLNGRWESAECRGEGVGSAQIVSHLHGLCSISASASLRGC